VEINIREGYDSAWIEAMMALYNKTELTRSDRQKVDRAFKKSYAVASCWHGAQLIGVGRMISDSEMYSGIFDVVVDPDYQKKGIGKMVMDLLISKAPNTCIHLTSTFGNEPFYFKLGFKPHKTAMSLYPEWLKESRYLNHNWKPE
jgi:GNAT superfamily N-acetyltransferase